MCFTCVTTYTTSGALALSSGTAIPLSSSIDPSEYSEFRETTKNITVPEIEQPTWLKKKIAERNATAQADSTRPVTGQNVTVTYDIATKGNLKANVNEFKLQANQTLNDPRGWARMNVTFKEVESGGQFSLVLAEASQVPSYSSGCSADYSCRVGRFVIINQDRWIGATPSWNVGGGSLRDYRHMVVNHETGHWLGHGHLDCGGAAGQPAAVMQQQSIDLQGCDFNPWPLAKELHSSTLGL